MYSLLIILQIIFSILLILVVLIQDKNVSLNLTSMGGGMWPVTKRGGEKVLQNTAIVLWVLFTLNAVLLFFIS